MAITSTILSTVPTSIYTSQGNNAITTMYICNTGNIAVQFDIHAVSAGQTANLNNVIYYQVLLEAKDTYVIDSEKLILSNNDSLQASVTDPALSSSQGLSDTLWGSTDNNVNDIVWSQDRNEYLVVGDSGKVAASSTAESWEFRSDLINLGWPANVRINGITKIPYKKYIAVGDGGWSASSSDGIQWEYTTAISSTTWGTGNIYAVTNNGSIYVAVGAGGRVATSLNGISWQFQSGLSSTGWGISDVWVIIWDGEQFVAGGDSGKIAYSVDGENWNYVSSLANNIAWGIGNRVTGLSYSGSSVLGYLVVTRDSNRSARSTNLTTWVYDNGLANVGDSVIPGAAGVTFKPGYGFYVIGLKPKIYRMDLSNTWVLYDDDLLSAPWSSTVASDLYWNAYNSEFVAIGYDARIATSPDAIVWTYRGRNNTANILIPNVVVTVSSIGI